MKKDARSDEVHATPSRVATPDSRRVSERDERERVWERASVKAETVASGTYGLAAAAVRLYADGSHILHVHVVTYVPPGSGSPPCGKRKKAKPLLQGAEKEAASRDPRSRTAHGNRPFQWGDHFGGGVSDTSVHRVFSKMDIALPLWA